MKIKQKKIFINIYNIVQQIVKKQKKTLNFI